MNEHEEAVTEDAEEAAEEVTEDVAANEWTPEELAELGEEPAPEVEPEPEATPVVSDFYEDLKEMGIDPTEYEPEYEPEPALDEPESTVPAPPTEEKDWLSEVDELANVQILAEARKQALHDRIRHDYDSHAPHSPEKIELFNNIAAQFEQLAHATIDQCPDGRDLSLALTHLEDAKRYAISAVVKG